MTPEPSANPVGTSRLLVAVGVSGAGHVVHNLAEFPPTVLLGPETLVPIGVTGALAWAMIGHQSRVAFLLPAAWAVTVIVFGGASVLPLSVWPFRPEQTTSHYAAHVAYAVAQLPLLFEAGRRSLAER